MAELEGFDQLSIGPASEAAQSSQQQSTQPIDVLGNWVIFNNLCSHLDIAGILPLLRVTKRWSDHLSAHLKLRWDINKKLRRFVTNPQNLRTELGRHDALISGSFAIQFFDGVVWDESDLDIYVEGARGEGGEGDAAIGRYLMEKEGYKLQTSKSLLDVNGYSTMVLLFTAVSLSRPSHLPSS